MPPIAYRYFSFESTATASPRRGVGIGGRCVHAPVLRSSAAILETLWTWKEMVLIVIRKYESKCTKKFVALPMSFYLCCRSVPRGAIRSRTGTQATRIHMYMHVPNHSQPIFHQQHKVYRLGQRSQNHLNQRLHRGCDHVLSIRSQR